MTAPEFLTVAEVAAIMRVAPMTVYRLCHAGELRSHRIGRSIRIDTRVVAAYLKAHVVSDEEVAW